MQQRLRLGSDSGTLTLHTGVEGRVAKVGHRLVIAIRDWEATATLSGDRAVSACMTAELSSFDVVSGEGGVKPLSDKDRAGIRDNGLQTLKAGAHPHVLFTSEDIQPISGGYSMTGPLSIAGVTRPTTVEVEVLDEEGGWRLRAAAAVVQSEYGITPYSAMMGGLKVSDRVEVRVDAFVPKG